MTARESLSVFAVIAALLCLSRPGAAQEAEPLSSEVVEAAERGRLLYDQGQYTQAIEVLTRAYELSQEPAFLQYVGRCHQELGHWCDAAEYYRRFLSEGSPPAEERVRLAGLRGEAARRCQQERDEASRAGPREDSNGPGEGDPSGPGEGDPGGPGEGDSGGAADEDEVIIEPLHTVDPQGSSSDSTLFIAGSSLLGAGLATMVAATVLWVLALQEDHAAESLSKELKLTDGLSDLEVDAMMQNMHYHEWRASRLALPGDILGFGIGPALIAAGVALMVVSWLRSRGRRSAAEKWGHLAFIPGQGLRAAWSWH